VENVATRLTFSQSSGKLQTVENKEQGLSASVEQSFFYYKSADLPTSGDDQQSSGAYIFRPNGTEPIPVSESAPLITLIQGPVVNEVRQMITPWITQSVSLYGSDPQVVFTYNVGSIPIDDQIGKEVISRFESNVDSFDAFYTDSNGREVLQRVKDYRPTWNYQVYEPVAGNYYPVNGVAYIKDSNRQISILNDRSQGVSSLDNGQLEFMVHRRTLRDDYRGVDEPMNETQSITPYPNPVRLGSGMGTSGSEYFLLTSPSTAASEFRPLMDRVFSEVYVSFAVIPTTSTAVADFMSSHLTQFSYSLTPLPPNIQLLTLQPFTGDSVLLRLSHQFAVGEDVTLSNTTTVDLATLFVDTTIRSATELSLTGNQAALKMKRPAYRTEDTGRETGVRGAPTEFVYDKTGKLEAVLVTLGPMEIKTFQVYFR